MHDWLTSTFPGFIFDPPPVSEPFSSEPWSPPPAEQGNVHEYLPSAPPADPIDYPSMYPQLEPPPAPMTDEEYFLVARRDLLQLQSLSVDQVHQPIVNSLI